MGIHVLSKIPIDIAKFLELLNPEFYTGHAFRRSTASAMAESGASSILMRTHFNWKSEATAMKYVESTDAQKLKISDFIQHNENEKKMVTKAKDFHFNLQNCTNFVFNMESEFNGHNG